MLKRYTTWTWAAVVLQFLTAGLHSLSFVATKEIKNDTERQLHELITTYHPEMGLGFHPSFWNLFTALSACLPLLCVMAALTLGYLLRKQVSPSLMKGILGIQVLIFGVLLVVTYILTFPPPIICVALIFAALVAAYLLAPKIEANI